MLLCDYRIVYVMKTTICVPLRLPSRSRSPQILRVDRVPRFRPVRSTITAMLAMAVSHSDLYVIRGGGDGVEMPALVRFNEVTGAFMNQAINVAATDFAGVEAAPNGDVFVLDNTLGYIRAFRLIADLASGGVFGPEPPRPCFSRTLDCPSMRTTVCW